MYAIWEIVSVPKKTMVDSKCLYKVKHAKDSSINKYKAWFVARGFSQKEEVDYEDIFAPVSN